MKYRNKLNVSVEHECPNQVQVASGRGLPIGLHNVKFFHLPFSKVMASVKNLKSRSNFKVRQSKMLVPVERAYHKEYTCEM